MRSAKSLEYRFDCEAQTTCVTLLAFPPVGREFYKVNDAKTCTSVSVSFFIFIIKKELER